jgi:hypothetical protein
MGYARHTADALVPLRPALSVRAVPSSSRVGTPGEGEGSEPPVPWVVAHQVWNTNSTAVPVSFMGRPHTLMGSRTQLEPVEPESFRCSLLSAAS